MRSTEGERNREDVTSNPLDQARRRSERLMPATETVADEADGNVMR